MQSDNRDLTIVGTPEAWIDHDIMTAYRLVRDFCGTCGW